MEEVREQIAGLDFNTILVLPVIYRCEVIGTLVLRTFTEGHHFTDREIGFCQLVANVSSSALKNAHLFEKIREESDELREVKERLEQELKEKSVFESLFEHASEGLMALNVRGEPVYINRAALDILGYSREEVTKLALHDFLTEESCQEALENNMNFFLGRDYKKKYDLIFKRKSGEKRCVSVSVSDHRLKGNYAIFSFTDVTEERKKSRQLAEANAHFKGLDTLKSNFINTATHELRIPVTILHSYCSLIKETDEGNLSERQLQYLDAALESGDRLVELVDDMLDLSKLDSTWDQLKVEAKNIMEPIQEVYADLSPLAERNGLVLCLEPVAGDIHILALFDNEKIKRVLTNLIGNAIKFTPKGGRIGISVSRNNDEVLISVNDTGIGIPGNYLDRIFDEFCQVKSLAGPKQGSGLGLAICKRIIDSHNGRIWVNSAPDKGSQFSFALPLSSGYESSSTS
jgi:PAS domain S-box-containing protein